VAADRRLSGTYHFTAEGTTTWYDFACCIISTAAPITGRNPKMTPITTADYPTPARRPANSRLDCSLFVKTFGFAPRPWRECAQATARTLAMTSQTAEKDVT
jgi:dTDP-4-dehydrorhamnose reductase